jgi:hypothetical protein
VVVVVVDVVDVVVEVVDVVDGGDAAGANASGDGAIARAALASPLASVTAAFRPNLE